MKQKSTHNGTMLDRRESSRLSPIWTKERGSVEWCYQKVAFLRDVFAMEQQTLQSWESAIKDLTTHRAWEKIPEQAPYGLPSVAES